MVLGLYHKREEVLAFKSVCVNGIILELFLREMFNDCTFFVSFISFLITTLIIIKTERLHHKLSHYHNLIGSQKFHKIAVPRIGGFALVFGLIC